MERCELCKFFSRHSEHDDYGYCKRHSPNMSTLNMPKQTPDLWWNEYCTWPNVRSNNWCGDFINMEKSNGNA